MMQSYRRTRAFDPVHSARIVRQSGQSSIEYVVVGAAVAFALGVGMSNHNSVLWELIEAFKTAYQNISYAISIPT
ncbi:MAG: hypothetical protein ABIT70_05555 [Sulfuriferula sp.]|jgi:hypothetical protein